MESFEYIESGLVFGMQTRDDLKKFVYPISAFAKHGDAYKFALSHFDEYGEFASDTTLMENYPLLDSSARSLNLDYAIEVFSNQVVHRKVVGTFQENKLDVVDNPKRALVNIMSELNEIAVSFDEDISSYTDESAGEQRLEAWKKRREIREKGNGMLGIPTMFKSMNKTGVGWLDGEMISIFARPTIGKTWACVASAVDATLAGYKTLLVSTEMPRAQIEMRTDVVAANRLGYNFSHTAIKTGEPIDEQAYLEFLRDMGKESLLVCDHIKGDASISLAGIESLIRKHQPDFVVVDGLYLVSSGQGKKQMWEQSHALFYGVKNLAMAHNIPIMVSTQATRDAANIFEPPRPDQVAFGDALIRASDIALSMYGIIDNDKNRAVMMQKYRDGEMPFETATLHWDVDKGDIKELEERF